MAETSPLPKRIKEIEDSKDHKFKVLMNTSAIDIEEALNNGWTIDEEGTKTVAGLIILYKEV